MQAHKGSAVKVVLVDRSIPFSSRCQCLGTNVVSVLADCWSEEKNWIEIHRKYPHMVHSDLLLTTNVMRLLAAHTRSRFCCSCSSRKSHYEILLDTFLTPAPMQDRKTVLLAACGLMLKVTPKKAFTCRSVLTAWGVSGPKRTSFNSSGPSAHNSITSPCR